MFKNDKKYLEEVLKMAKKAQISGNVEYISEFLENFLNSEIIVKI